MYPTQICDMHATHNQFLEKLKKWLKTIQNDRFIVEFFYVNNFTLWAR